LLHYIILVNTLTTKYVKSSEAFRREGEKGHGKGKAKAHRIGDRISFKTPNGRTSGAVVKVSKEFYIVKCKNKLYKVNRNSILYSLGTFIGGMHQMAQNVKKSYEFGKQKENERLDKFKRSYGKATKKPVRKRKVKHSLW
jgi:hypothetical protein